MLSKPQFIKILFLCQQIAVKTHISHITRINRSPLISKPSRNHHSHYLQHHHTASMVSSRKETRMANTTNHQDHRDNMASTAKHHNRGIYLSSNKHQYRDTQSDQRHLATIQLQEL
jgi:hypothetical protein